MAVAQPRYTVDSETPINEDGVLLKLRFSAVGKAGAVSPLTFEKIIYNEGELPVVLTNGRVELK